MSALVTTNGYIPNTYAEIKDIGTAMVASGYFSDAQKASQAIVKIMAGSELGLPPFAAMTGIHIIKGKPALGANLIATLIKNDPRYNYKVIEHTDKVCKIEYFEDGESAGFSEFTAADAQKAGTQNMHKFPKNMLFARAMSNGAKWYTPGIFGGTPVYTPDELGAEVDEDGNILKLNPEPVPPQNNGAADEIEEAVFTEAEPAVNTKEFHACGRELYGKAWDEKRPAIVQHFGNGATSSKELTQDQIYKALVTMQERLHAIKRIWKLDDIYNGDLNAMLEERKVLPLYNLTTKQLNALNDELKGSGNQEPTQPQLVADQPEYA